MNPQNLSQPAEPANSDNPLAVMEPGEQIICEIKRHPIGLFGMYLGVGFVLLLIAVGCFVALPSFESNHREALIIGFLIFVASGAVALIFLFITNKIYWGNRWIVTSHSITQVSRTGLFDKQTSQLSFGDLEDITAEQDGLLAQMLHYGVLSAETAAATDKFMFPFCPNPTDYARQILTAREQFEQARRTA